MTISLFARLAHRFEPERMAITRRDALKASLAASAGLLMSATALGRALQPEAPADAKPGDGKPPTPPADPAPTTPRRNGKSVIVVGAGFAGLACAYELASVGYDVTVFEARSRLGGRVLSVKDMCPGKVAEGGGEFIGANHPAWLTYAKRFGLEMVPATDEPDLASPIYLDGRALPPELAVEVYKGMERALRIFNTDALQVNANTPWLSPRAAEFESMSVGEWFRGVNADELTRRAVRVMLEADQGTSLEAMGYLPMLAMIKGGGVEKFWTQSEAFRCKGGNQQLAVRLADAIGTQRIRLSKPVARIDITQRRPTVILKDNERHTADHVVLTIAPSVWDKATFGPPEVMRKLADMRIQMGSATKFLAGVEKPFWAEDKLSSVSTSEGPVNITWNCTAGQAGNGEVLCGFAGGPSAEITRKMSPQQQTPASLAALGRLYPRIVEQKVNARYMNWPDDPWVKAGYGFPAPGQVTRLGPSLMAGLSADEGPAQLHIAGESISHAFPGYMEGALQTGAAAASRIAAIDAEAARKLNKR